MNEIKMTVKEAIEQLTDLKRDREGFAKNDEPDSVFAYDYKAIDVAITVMEMIIDEMPTIEAEPIKHGEWKQCFIDCGKQIEGNECSICGIQIYGGSKVDFKIENVSGYSNSAYDSNFLAVTWIENNELNLFTLLLEEY